MLSLSRSLSYPLNPSLFVALPENYAEMEDPRRKQKRPWSPKEIAAVMRHFQEHIANGKLATVVEIKQCRSGEHPTLASRPVQNIMDFVRNRGLIQKRKKQQKENSCWMNKHSLKNICYKFVEEKTGGQKVRRHLWSVSPLFKINLAVQCQIGILCVHSSIYKNVFKI